MNNPKWQRLLQMISKSAFLYTLIWINFHYVMKYAIWTLCAEELYYESHECPLPGLYSTSLFDSGQIAQLLSSMAQLLTQPWD